MFRTLIYLSSGAYDYSVELPHWSYCSWFDVCWCFGVAGLEWYPCCRLKPEASDIKLVFYFSIILSFCINIRIMEIFLLHLVIEDNIYVADSSLVVVTGLTYFETNMCINGNKCIILQRCCQVVREVG